MGRGGFVWQRRISDGFSISTDGSLWAFEKLICRNGKLNKLGRGSNNTSSVHCPSVTSSIAEAAVSSRELKPQQALGGRCTASGDMFG